MNLGIGEDFRYNIKGTVHERKKWQDELQWVQIFFAKDTSKKMRRQDIGLETIFAKDICYKRLLSEVYEECLKLESKKIKQPNLKNDVKTWTDTSAKKIAMGNKNMKRSSTSYIIREMQI